MKAQLTEIKYLLKARKVRYKINDGNLRLFRRDGTHLCRITIRPTKLKTKIMKFFGMQVGPRLDMRLVRGRVYEEIDYKLRFSSGIDLLLLGNCMMIVCDGYTIDLVLGD